MALNDTSVDSYLQDGCGRCDRYRTPSCKVHRWTGALKVLRAVALESGLTEAMKWGSPCYTLSGKNVVAIASFNDFCALSFFKGALLDDPDGLLVAPGPNSRSVRSLRFTSAKEARAGREIAARFIARVIDLERSGAKLELAPAAEPMPGELQAALDADPALAKAFAALTPGRQRSHVLHVSGAKQVKTRQDRAERCAAKILAGKGYNER